MEKGRLRYRTKKKKKDCCRWQAWMYIYIHVTGFLWISDVNVCGLFKKWYKKPLFEIRQDNF